MKTFLINLMLLVSISLHATDNDVVYVVFTPHESSYTQATIVHLPVSPDFDTQCLRCPRHFFKLKNSELHFWSHFFYENALDKPANPITVKPISFLDEVEYIDFDVVAPKMTRDELKELKDSISSHKTIYFIDKNEFENGMMKMYPVREFKGF